MHMSDALLSPAVGGAMYAVSAVSIAYAVQKVKKDDLGEKNLPMMAVAGAFTFAAQMINFTIPGTGSSGHIGGGILLAGQMCIRDRVEAAKAAHVHRFVQTLPGGYNMELNEEASNVSQGQKQLLTIARAILEDPKILILDEATSSVDTRTEIQIQKAMDNLMRGRTSFIIAHRLSTIRDADLILVMKDGDIVEQGNHEELLAKNGFYADLYNSQFERSA